MLETAWLIPVIPAVSAGLLLLFGRRLGPASGWVAVAACGASALLAAAVFATLAGLPADAREVTHTVATWISAGDLEVAWAVLVDPLSAVMLLLVTWVGLLIHIYSVGYMHGDERYHQFFAYLNLFIASMTILVLGESFLVLFVGWELVGLCSYLLIGFWFSNREYAGAAKKAFVVNRVGDVGFLLAMFVLFSAAGTLSFTEVLPNAGMLGTGTAVAVGLLLLVAAAGKSAQIPLYVWLPDAMAGPTPVSALIHAATMVTAGVYLIARTSAIYAQSFEVGMAVAWVGIATALLAAVIATAQVDLKKILAYSTVSQLGLMFVGVGVGEHTAAIFHLLTHGFFKALLFLAAGSVMHALANETNVWRMGGLAKAMPVTAVTAGIATLAIAGVPPLSGFWSKEEILAATAATPGGQAIWVLGIITAALTAFYMGRWFILIFLGRPRWADGLHPHESPLSMSAPLVILAVLSAAGGVINLPGNHLLQDWLEPSVVAFTARVDFLPHSVLLAAAVLAGLGGLASAWNLYLRRGYEPGAWPARFPRLYAWTVNRFYVDELYSHAIVTPGHVTADGLAAFDRSGIDGAVNGLARGTAALANSTRGVQNGLVRSYALAVLAGAVLIMVVLVGLAVVGG
jgi:NADH-quinone oxidoreductase subunit L